MAKDEWSAYSPDQVQISETSSTLKP